MIFETKYNTPSLSLSVPLSRKRVVSTGVDTEKSSLLRKNTIVNATPKSQLIEGVDILTVANETNLSILNILLPNNQTLTLKVDSDKLAEDVLSILCSRRGLEYGEHTFLLPNKEKVSMDKPIKLIAPIGIPTEISVIKSQKKYDTVCLSENGRDVLVLRNDGNR